MSEQLPDATRPDTVIEMTRKDLDEIIEAAAERGAKRALKDLGLDDESAHHDVRDLRDLIKSWREVRSVALQTTAKIVTTAILTAIVIGVGVRLGIGSLFAVKL